MKTLGQTPTPIAVVKERTHATRDAGMLILGSVACLAISIGAYISRDSLKASERKAQDIAALRTSNTTIKEVKDAGIDAPMAFEDLSGKALKTTKDAGIDAVVDAARDLPMTLGEVTGRTLAHCRPESTLCDLATELAKVR